MRRILYLLIMVAAAMKVDGQAAVSSLNENFDVSCVTTPNFPAHWITYNPIASTLSYGKWGCNPTRGRSGTPGMTCNGYYSGFYHLDTAYLVTPLLNVSSYPGRVFFHFDSKTSNVYRGSRLAVIYAPSYDSNFHSYTDTDLTRTPAFMPLFSNADSSNWVTHIVDLTDYKGSDFYIGFRFTSTDTTGAIWDIDNVGLSTTNMVTDAKNEPIALSIVNSTTNKVTLYFTAPAGAYRLALFDLIGKQVYTETVYSNGDKTIHQIDDLALHPGIYVAKMKNEYNNGVTKLIVQ